MISAFQSALTGLQAYGTKAQSHANNIANANTDGYKSTRVILQSAEPQGVKTKVEKVNTPGPQVFQQTNNGEELVELSNVDLAKELTYSNLNSHMYKANLKTIQATDEMLGSLLKIKT